MTKTTKLQILLCFPVWGNAPLCPCKSFFCTLCWNRHELYFLAAKLDKAMASHRGPDAHLAQNDRSPLIFTSDCAFI